MHCILNEISKGTEMIMLNPRELSCPFKRKLKREQLKQCKQKAHQIRQLNSFRPLSVVQMNMSQCEAYL